MSYSSSFCKCTSCDCLNHGQWPPAVPEECRGLCVGCSSRCWPLLEPGRATAGAGEAAVVPRTSARREGNEERRRPTASSSSEREHPAPPATPAAAPSSAPEPAFVPTETSAATTITTGAVTPAAPSAPACSSPEPAPNRVAPAPVAQHWQAPPKGQRQQEQAHNDAMQFQSWLGPVRQNPSQRPQPQPQPGQPNSIRFVTELKAAREAKQAAARNAGEDGAPASPLSKAEISAVALKVANESGGTAQTDTAFMAAVGAVFNPAGEGSGGSATGAAVAASVAAGITASAATADDNDDEGGAAAADDDDNDGDDATGDAVSEGADPSEERWKQRQQQQAQRQQQAQPMIPSGESREDKSKSTAETGITEADIAAAVAAVAAAAEEKDDAAAAASEKAASVIDLVSEREAGSVIDLCASDKEASDTGASSEKSASERSGSVVDLAASEDENDEGEDEDDDGYPDYGCDDDDFDADEYLSRREKHEKKRQQRKERRKEKEQQYYKDLADASEDDDDDDEFLRELRRSRREKEEKGQQFINEQQEGILKVWTEEPEASGASAAVAAAVAALSPAERFAPARSKKKDENAGAAPWTGNAATPKDPAGGGGGGTGRSPKRPSPTPGASSSPPRYTFGPPPQAGHSPTGYAQVRPPPPPPPPGYSPSGYFHVRPPNWAPRAPCAAGGPVTIWSADADPAKLKFMPQYSGPPPPPGLGGLPSPPPPPPSQWSHPGGCRDPRGSPAAAASAASARTPPPSSQNAASAKNALTSKKRPVEQVCRETGNVLHRYASISQAARAVEVDGSGIRACLSGRSKSCGGFFWRYPGSIEAPPQSSKKNSFVKRPVEKLCMRTGSVLDRYGSIGDAAKAIGAAAAGISLCLNGTNKSCGNFAWRYAGGIEAPPPSKPNAAAPAANKYTFAKRPVEKLCRGTGAVLDRYGSINEAAKAIGAAASGISLCLNGTIKSCGGFAWRYAAAAGGTGGAPAVEKVCRETGNVLDRYDSVNDAARAVEVHASGIRACLNGQSKSSGGFLWRYAGGIEAPPSSQNAAAAAAAAKKNVVAKKPVEKVHCLTGNVLHRYPSIADAARALGVAASGISLCLNGTTKSCGGFLWRYAGGTDGATAAAAHRLAVDRAAYNGSPTQSPKPAQPPKPPVLVTALPAKRFTQEQLKTMPVAFAYDATDANNNALNSSRDLARKRQSEWDREMRKAVGRYKRRRAGGSSTGSGGANRGDGVGGGRAGRGGRGAAGRGRGRGVASSSSAARGGGSRASNAAMLVYDKPATEIGPGWTVKAYERRGGSYTGHQDRYWFSPATKKKFRSMKEINRYNEILDGLDGGGGGGNEDGENGGTMEKDREEEAWLIFKRSR